MVIRRGDATLLRAIQHPAEGEESHFAAPSTRWPDFAAGVPPRPMAIAIMRKGCGPIG